MNPKYPQSLDHRRRPPSHSASLHHVQQTATVILTLLLLTVLSNVDTSSTTESQLSPGDSVLPSQMGRFDFSELEDIVYGMPVISTGPVVDTDVPGVGRDAESNHVIMISKYGQRYSCVLPVSTAEDSVENGNSDVLVAEALPNISDLLKPMRSAPCLHKTEGWWTYEYCHGLYLKQYHIEAGKPSGESQWLGFYAQEATWDQQLVDKVKANLETLKDSVGDSVAYHAAYYVNGTTCDITGKPRAATARIYCGIGPDKIVEIREKETCNYTISIESSRVCSHPLFRTKASITETHAIVCHPVLTSDDYQDYLLQQEKQQQRSREQNPSNQEVEEHVEANDVDELKQAIYGSLTKLLELSSSLFDSGVNLDELEMDTEGAGEVVKEKVDEELSKTDEDTGDGDVNENIDDNENSDQNEQTTSDSDLINAVHTLFQKMLKETESKNDGKIRAPLHPIPIPHDKTKLEGSKEKEIEEDGSDETDTRVLLEDAARKHHAAHLQKTRKDAEKLSDLGEKVDHADRGLEDERKNDELHETLEDFELQLQESLKRAGIDAEAKVKVVKLPKDADAEKYLDEHSNKMDTEKLKDEDLTPPVPSYLMDDEELNREQKLRTFQHVTNQVADTLAQWLNEMETDGTNSGERQQQQTLENSYQHVWESSREKKKKQG